MFWTELLLFGSKILLVVFGIFLFLLMVASLKKKRAAASSTALKLVSLNEHYDEVREQLEAVLLDEKALENAQKQRKADKKQKKKHPESKPRLFVMDFEGDVEASDTEDMREQISALLQVATPQDKVLLRLESAGGYVHSYGLAASQLARFREKQIPLVVSVDKVAASGGYMMACVANEILAAPFAIIGSVGVVAGIPNVHQLLKKHDVDYELHTAGKYKRTLTVMGENTEEGRAQFRKELQETHELFKAHIHRMRPQLTDIDEIATGETWYGQVALDKQLVDVIKTSDDYLLEHLDSHQIIWIKNEEVESLLSRLKSKFLGQASVATPFKHWIQ